MNKVTRPIDDLSREVWTFSTMGGFRLDSYGIERRTSAKGRFKNATIADRWMSSDTRRYYSGMNEPETIPQDVINEAIGNMTIRVYIGWSNEDYLFQTVKLSDWKVQP